MCSRSTSLGYQQGYICLKALPSTIVPPKPLCQHLAWKSLIALSVIYLYLSLTAHCLGIFILNQCLYQKFWQSNFVEVEFLPFFPPSPQNWEAETHEICTWSFQHFNSESFQCGALSGGFPHMEYLCARAKSHRSPFLFSRFTHNQWDAFEFSIFKLWILSILHNVSGTLFCLGKIPKKS